MSVSIGLGDYDGRCAVVLSINGDEGTTTVTLSAIGARAYGNILLQSAQEADRVNATTARVSDGSPQGRDAQRLDGEATTARSDEVGDA